MIKIAIVEDDSTIREAIKEFLDSKENLSCNMAHESVESLLSVLNNENKPDVILMDIGLPGMSGISGIKLIKERFPDINTIMLTVYHDTHKIFQSLCAGASGYLLKNSPFSEIKKAILKTCDPSVVSISLDLRMNQRVHIYRSCDTSFFAFTSLSFFASVLLSHFSGSIPVSS